MNLPTQSTEDVVEILARRLDDLTERVNQLEDKTQTGGNECKLNFDPTEPECEACE